MLPTEDRTHSGAADPGPREAVRAGYRSARLMLAASLAHAAREICRGEEGLTRATFAFRFWLASREVCPNRREAERQRLRREERALLKDLRLGYRAQGRALRRARLDALAAAEAGELARLAPNRPEPLPILRIRGAPST